MARPVFPPGYRVTDDAGAVVSGAKLKFYASGTTTPLTVYADAALGSSLGSTVRTRSDGLPVSDGFGGTTPTLIYVSAAFKVEITDEDDAVIVPAFDAIPSS